MSEPAQHVLPPSWQLSEKVAVVTGGSRGIGRAIATTLAARGAKVAVNYTKNEAAAAAVVDAIKAAGGEAMAIGFDVADPAAVDAGIKAVKEAFGGLHILVNNAGISIDALLLRASLDDLHKTLAINLSGAFTCAKAAARHLLRARADGRIINISSVVGEQGNAGQSMYAASKAGLIGLTKSLARELAGRDGVDQVAPFGTTLHVVGADEDLLETALEDIRARHGVTVERGETSLEDVFIQFMAGSKDNMG